MCSLRLSVNLKMLLIGPSNKREYELPLPAFSARIFYSLFLYLTTKLRATLREHFPNARFQSSSVFPCSLRTGVLLLQPSCILHRCQVPN